MPPLLEKWAAREASDTQSSHATIGYFSAYLILSLKKRRMDEKTYSAVDKVSSCSFFGLPGREDVASRGIFKVR